tara:strand:- start:482 stop:721 length:240 start_codon:yes stop_codon:yes gene_type:complete
MSNSSAQPKYDKPFIAYDSTPIMFGKYKGKPHEVLKDPANLRYVSWIMGLKDFGETTKQYIRDNRLDWTPKPDRTDNLR